MKVKKAFQGLASANLVVLMFLAIIFADAVQKSYSSPIPLFGHWTELQGRKADTASNWEMNVSTSSIPSGNYCYSVLSADLSDWYNKTFVRAVLELKVKSDKPALVGLAIFERHDFYHIQDYFEIIGEMCYRILVPAVLFETSDLTTKITWDRKVLSSESFDWERVTTTTVEEIRCFPCIFWSAEAEVNATYSETWMHTPLVGYDETVIELGVSRLSVIPMFLLNIIVCDGFIVCTLVGLWLSNYAKKETEEN